MHNPYYTTRACVDRLITEYRKHPKLIIAVDHDDTVFDFHKKGYNYITVISLVRKCKELGFYITVFTGTPAEKWCEIHDYWDNVLKIPFDSINRNPISLPFGNDGKIYYNILLDDRAGLGQSVEILTELVHWIVMQNHIKNEMKEFYKNAVRV